MIRVHIDDDGATASIDGIELTVHDVVDETVIAEADTMAVLGDHLIADFPLGMSLRIHDPHVFGTGIFWDIDIRRGVDGVDVRFECHHPNKYWEGKYGLATLLDASVRARTHRDRTRARRFETLIAVVASEP